MRFFKVWCQRSTARQSFRRNDERDLALGLRVIWCTADMIHSPIVQPVSQFSRDVTRAVVAEQAPHCARRVSPKVIAARSPQCHVQLISHIFGLHYRAELPGDDVPVVIVEDRREIEPTPADDFEIGEVGLPAARQSPLAAMRGGAGSGVKFCP